MHDAINRALDKIESNLINSQQHQRELADRVMSLEQRGSIRAEPTGKSAGLGDLVVKAFDANKDLFTKTRSVRLELKAAGDPITTTNGRKILGVGVGAPGGGVLGLQNAIPTRPTGGTTAAEYSRYTGQQGAAGVQAAEGDAKAAVRPDHSLITQVAITIAGYTKMSRQALTDSEELRRAVDSTLNRSVATALDVALVDGVVTPAFTGFEALATASTSLVYDTLPDAVSEGVAAMQVAGFSPDSVALNPTDWLAITVAKGVANDHYLSGSYLGVLPLTMRGLRVVLSPSVDAGKALLMDTSHSELLIVDDFSVEIGYVDQDFTKNLVTLLGEIRVIPVFRTVGSARLITPMA
jgi:HK97 family phage major capsid protein